MIKIILLTILIYVSVVLISSITELFQYNGPPNVVLPNYPPVKQQPPPVILPVISVNYKDDEPLIEQAPQQNENTPIELDSATSLSLLLKRKTVQLNSYNEQTFPMLVSLKMDRLTTQNRVPVDLICVIDHSGSMHGDKIELVKSSLVQLLDFMGDQDRISIVIFDDSAERIVPLLRTTEENKAMIKAAISGITSRGGTDINLGLTHALEILKQRRYSNPIASIFLLSDGLDIYGGSAKIPLTIKKYELQDAISINTFGFGNDHDAKMMSSIADLRDGNFYFIDKLEKVDEAFADCLGGLLSLVAREVILKVKPEQSGVLNGVAITSAYGNENMWAEEDGQYVLKTSDLMGGKQKDFLLMLKLPITRKDSQSQQDRVKIASAEAIFTEFYGQKTVKKVDLYISVLPETKALPTEEDDLEVMKSYYRVKSALAMQEAQRLADKERYVEAEKVLESCKEEMENSLLKDDEITKSFILNILKTIENVKPDNYQTTGQQYIYSDSRSQMQQRSSVTSPYSYQTQQQTYMKEQVKASRGYGYGYGRSYY